MTKRETTSISVKNHFLIFAVTLAALAAICLFTLNSAFNLSNGEFTSRAQTQVIFDKPVPSGLEAATKGIDAVVSGETSLPLSPAIQENKIDSDSAYQMFWLFGILLVIGSSLFFMFRALKEDHDMQAVSQLYTFARTEH